MITFHNITLFGEAFDSYIGSSIIKRAIENKKIKVINYNPRDFVIASKGKTLSYSEKRVDNRPYGGGPGMVIEALPVIKAIDKAVGKYLKDPKKKKEVKIVFFSPSGEQFTNKVADNFKKYKHIVFVCGRYEGIDARVKKVFPMVDISVGPYVLTGGELPAMIMIDAISRRVKGVLGDINSLEEERVAGKDVYTRPESFVYKNKKYQVPKVLLSGNHAEIEGWKKKINETVDKKVDKI